MGDIDDGGAEPAMQLLQFQPRLAAQFGVRAIPTLLVIKNGQVAEQMVGAKSKRDLKASLDRATA